MATDLVIVESPGKIKTIKKILGRGYEVKASLGHVRDLPGKNTGGGRGRKKKTAAEAAEKEAELVSGVGPDFTPRYVLVDSKLKTVADLRKAAAKANYVWLCPDPDREGEAIAWHLQEALGLPTEKIKRASFDEITPKAIRAAFKTPRTLDLAKVNAQQARRILDRLVGYRLSPLLWDKFVRGLSAGRVQSPAVRLIVDREREIAAFIKEEYWTISAVFATAGQSFDAELRALGGMQIVSSAEDLRKFKLAQNKVSSSGILRTRLTEKAEAEELAALLRQATYKVANYEVREVSDRPYPPFATSQLQQAAANRLGFDASRTMRIAQQLYEGIDLPERGQTALITYMRTDSFRIANDALDACRTMIAKNFGEQYLPEKPNVYRSRRGAQEAHECIRPTEPDLHPDAIRDALSTEQYKLYRLIWQRFVACQMRPALFDAATCDLAAQQPEARFAVFRATGRVLKFDGWLRVYGGAQALAAAHLDVAERDREKGDEPELSENGAAAGNAEGAGATAADGAAAQKTDRARQTQTLPAMSVGEAADLRSLDPRQHFTQPPPRYTEASLVKALEREGIGRPSTYATIVSTIQQRLYVEKLGHGGRGSFRATTLGCAVTDRLVSHFPSIVDFGFTREMEMELDKIEEEQLDWRQVLRDFYGPFSRDLEKARVEMPSNKEREEPTDFKCPECHAPMGKRLGRFGEYLRCSRAPECKTTLNLDTDGNIRKKDAPADTGIKCDLCGSPVVKTAGRFGPYFCCSRYLTKECTFTMRLAKDGRPIRKLEPPKTELSCGKCKHPLLVRVSARGKREPRAFLSCSNFPRCRAAEELPAELAALGELALKNWRESDEKNRSDWEIMRTTMKAAEEALPENGGGESEA